MIKVPRIIWWGLGGVAVFIILLTLGAILLETNPPVKQEPTWDSPQTRALAKRACFDCHSNETEWPWYTKVPVGSWLVVFDTVRGRNHLNFSEWGNRNREGSNAREVARNINDGSMPPNIYTTMHPNAILTAQEKQQLVQGLQNSLK